MSSDDEGKPDAGIAMDEPWADTSDRAGDMAVAIGIAADPAGDGVGAAFDEAAASASADEKEIERLAGLDPLTYDRERQAAAGRLGVRASTLDTQVKKHREKLGLTGLDQDGPGFGRALTLPDPDPWPHHVDAAGLLDGLRSTITRFVVMPQESAVAVTPWIVFTHLIDQFDFAPRLLIKSPMPRCGKTTLLDIVGELVPRPLMAANITPAATFRAIEAAQPTLLIDEADTFMARSDELRGVINSGHRRSNARVIRVVEISGEHEPRAFSTWCPMAIAGIGTQHTTIIDRSFVVELQRKLFGDPVARLDRKAREELAAVARKVARVARDMGGRLNDDPPDVPVELNDRAADNWRVALAIADAAGGHWPQTARAAARAAAGQAEPETLLTTLLVDIRDVFTRRGNPEWLSTTKDLIPALVGTEERPWPSMPKSGKPLTRSGSGHCWSP